MKTRWLCGSKPKSLQLVMDGWCCSSMSACAHHTQRLYDAGGLLAPSSTAAGPLQPHPQLPAQLGGIETAAVQALDGYLLPLVAAIRGRPDLTKSTLSEQSGAVVSASMQHRITVCST